VNSTPEILIVDDNTFNVYSLKLIIEEAFFLPCESAHSAKEALQLIKDRLIDGKGVHRLILTDINMPEIDGL
jgi:CheY-like chemotaxis protein